MAYIKSNPWIGVSGWLVFSTCVLVILSFATAVFASPTGSIVGTVKDPSGASISGAELTLTNLATNAKTEAVSDSNGNFQFLQLAPAEYSLVVQSTGFKKLTEQHILVQVDQITHVDVGLQVGSVLEVVEVASAVPLLETDRSTMSNVVNSTEISNLPLNARQYLDLALVTPGTVPSAAGTQGGGFNVAGARSQSNVFLLDGVSNIDTQVNSALGNFRITDAVQEFAVQTSVATAEFGRGTGGQVSIVTKSGTNQFHGSAFEYLRNDILDARDFFTNKNGGQKTPLHRNQYGATLGGPILKERLFFFLSYEAFRQVAPQVSSTQVPTDAQRASVTDPISKSLLQFWPRANTTGGSRINYIANVRATTFDETGLAKVDYTFSEKDHLMGRWAQYGGTTFTPGALPLQGGNANSPVSDSGVIDYTHTFSPRFLNEVRLGFSRNQTFITVQDSGFDASKIFVDASGNPLPGVVVASKNGLDSGLPTITVGGSRGFARLGGTSNLPQGRITNTYEAYDNMSLIAPFGASKHSWRWGVHIRREDARRFLDGSARGAFSFSNFTDFAAGNVNTATLRFGQTVRYWRRYPWDLYWQDTYKVKDNLTLNYGVRYEYPSAIYQTRQEATNFIPGVGPVLLGTNELLAIDPNKKGPASFFFQQAPFTLSDSGVNADKNNFAPVLGFAYTPRFAKSFFGNDSTVIRGGFRVGYDEIFNNIPANLGLNAPFTLTTTQSAKATQNGKKFPWAVGFNQNVPLVTNIGKPNQVGLVGINAEDPNLRSSYIYQYSLGIQRRLGSAFSLEADYQGSTGHKLGLFVDQNQPSLVGGQRIFPYPFFGSVGTGRDIGNSNYNGMVVTATYQGRHGVYFEGSYTFGKSIDNGSAFFGSSGEPAGLDDANNMRADRGPSSFDVRHHAVFTYVIDLPVGPGHRLLGWNNGVNRQVFGGWQISGITTIQSGTPFTVFNDSADFSLFNQFIDRPDVVGSGPLRQNNGNPDAAFDTTYFSKTPPTGRVGNSGRNQYYGPSLSNYNFSVAKAFPLGTERVHLRFRVDFFNLFNHTNFANPVSNQGSDSFGKITSTVGSGVATAVGTTAGVVGGGPRVIQGALRVEF